MALILAVSLFLSGCKTILNGDLKVVFLTDEERRELERNQNPVKMEIANPNMALTNAGAYLSEYPDAFYIPEDYSNRSDHLVSFELLDRINDTTFIYAYQTLKYEEESANSSGTQNSGNESAGEENSENRNAGEEPDTEEGGELFVLDMGKDEEERSLSDQMVTVLAAYDYTNPDSYYEIHSWTTEKSEDRSLYTQVIYEGGSGQTGETAHVAGYAMYFNGWAVIYDTGEVSEFMKNRKAAGYREGSGAALGNAFIHEFKSDISKVAAEIKRSLSGGEDYQVDIMRVSFSYAKQQYVDVRMQLSSSKTTGLTGDSGEVDKIVNGETSEDYGSIDESEYDVNYYAVQMTFYIINEPIYFETTNENAQSQKDYFEKGSNKKKSGVWTIRNGAGGEDKLTKAEVLEKAAYDFTDPKNDDLYKDHASDYTYYSGAWKYLLNELKLEASYQSPTPIYEDPQWPKNTKDTKSRSYKLTLGMKDIAGSSEGEMSFGATGIVSIEDEELLTASRVVRSYRTVGGVTVYSGTRTERTSFIKSRVIKLSDVRVQRVFWCPIRVNGAYVYVSNDRLTFYNNYEKDRALWGINTLETLQKSAASGNLVDTLYMIYRDQSLYSNMSAVQMNLSSLFLGMFSWWWTYGSWQEGEIQDIASLLAVNPQEGSAQVETLVYGDKEIHVGNAVLNYEKLNVSAVVKAQQDGLTAEQELLDEAQKATVLIGGAERSISQDPEALKEYVASNDAPVAVATLSLGDDAEIRPEDVGTMEKELPTMSLVFGHDAIYIYDQNSVLMEPDLTYERYLRILRAQKAGKTVPKKDAVTDKTLKKYWEQASGLINKYLYCYYDIRYSGNIVSFYREEKQVFSADYSKNFRNQPHEGIEEEIWESVVEMVELHDKKSGRTTKEYVVNDKSPTRYKLFSITRNSKLWTDTGKAVSDWVICTPTSGMELVLSDGTPYIPVFQKNAIYEDKKNSVGGKTAYVQQLTRLSKGMSVYALYDNLDQDKAQYPFFLIGYDGQDAFYADMDIARAKVIPFKIIDTTVQQSEGDHPAVTPDQGEIGVYYLKDCYDKSEYEILRQAEGYKADTSLSYEYLEDEEK